MSYILDALQKAQQQRDEPATPTLVPTSAGASNSPHRVGAGRQSQGRERSVWPWAIATGLLGAALAGGVWLRQEPTPGASLAAPPAAQMSMIPPAPLPAPLPFAASTSATPAPVPSAPRLDATPPASPDPAPSRALPTVAAGGMAQQRPPTPGMSSLQGWQGQRPPPERPMAQIPPITATDSAPAAPPTRATPAAAAPLGNLPGVVIQGAVYSDDRSQRMVIVNGRVMHEGDEAAPGAVIEAIGPTSMRVKTPSGPVQVVY